MALIYGHFSFKKEKLGEKRKICFNIFYEFYTRIKI